MSITVDTVLPTGTWSVDPVHSGVEFSAKHLGIATVRGVFREFEGTLDIREDGTAEARGSVSAASLDTNVEARDVHLRSEDFFHVEAHPKLSFESTEIRALDVDVFRIHGKLMMRGVTRPVLLHAQLQGTQTDQFGNERVALEVTGQLNRRDWDMSFNQVLESGRLLISDKVKLSIDISAIKQS
jgi:polyisoprenoid-binding protein YceI